MPLSCQKALCFPNFDTILTGTLTSEKKKKSQDLDLLSVELRKRNRKKISGIKSLFVSVACCCSLCAPNMTITKTNTKENLGEFICLSITKAKAK